jgi:hypothetical protein
MKFQIVTDDGELVYSGGAPVSADLTRVLEREIIRRELGMAKILRDHLAAAADDQDLREGRLLEQFKQEHWELALAHANEMDDVAELLEGSKVDVSAWRLVRRRRERIFAERIDGIVKEMLVMTRRGS